MASTTTNLGLRKPDTTDLVDVTLDLNGNYDKIDNVPGILVCTSATRPTSPWEGRAIYETDSKRSWIWNGTAWLFLSGPVPSVLVRSNVDISVAAGTETVITFNTEDEDTDVQHDNITNNNRLTCKLAGKYHVFGKFRWLDTVSISVRQIQLFNQAGVILVNNSTPEYDAQWSRTNQFSLDHRMAVNDWLEVKALHGANTGKSIAFIVGSSPYFGWTYLGS